SSDVCSSDLEPSAYRRMARRPARPPGSGRPVVLQCLTVGARVARRVRMTPKHDASPDPNYDRKLPPLVALVLSSVGFRRVRQTVRLNKQPDETRLIDAFVVFLSVNFRWYLLHY